MIKNWWFSCLYTKTCCGYSHESSHFNEMVHMSNHNMFWFSNKGDKSEINYIYIYWALFYIKINRGPYMGAHVLLNLLNELGKRDKMRGLPSILSLFRNKFNKFNNTRAWMLDSIYHIILRLLLNLISDVKTLWFCHYVCNVVMDVMAFQENM